MTRSLQKLCGGIATAATLAFAPAAHAGIPTIDVAAIVAAIEQVMAWADQYEQMVTQIESLEQQIQQAEKQYSSLTGSRGLGSLLTNKKFDQELIPADWDTRYDSIRSSGYDGLSSSAKSMRDKNKIYNCAERSGADRTACQNVLNQTAQEQADTANALKLGQERVDQIDGLQAEINNTDDPKAIAELQARLQAETSNLNNDTNRLALLRAHQDAGRRAAEQEQKERELAWITKSGDGTSGFSLRK